MVEREVIDRPVEICMQFNYRSAFPWFTSFIHRFLVLHQDANTKKVRGNMPAGRTGGRNVASDAPGTGKRASDQRLRVWRCICASRWIQERTHVRNNAVERDYAGYTYSIMSGTEFEVCECGEKAHWRRGEVETGV